ncbi:MAG TPA: PRC-barrel domain-containing protein [Stellaceae bacterium]|nr:PRC-barrel domain-containing protein [Stellaceae bacterium]
MRSKLIATASAFVLLAGTALAQTAPPSATNRTPNPGNSMSTTATPAVRTPAPDPLKMEDVSKISGSAVYGSDDSKIGSVSTVLMNPESKTIDRLVVSAGGVLGVGGHKAAVAVDEFKWDSDKGGFKIAKTSDDIKAMPEWQNQTASTQ